MLFPEYPALGENQGKLVTKELVQWLSHNVGKRSTFSYILF